MTHLPVSVVVVSRGRPDALRRCLGALAQQRYDPFEVIVVADAPGRAMLRALPLAAHVHVLACDEANISTARNIGIAAVAADIVAFIDDDAVAEPTWLAYLVAPFGDPQVMAAGGFVRARNGISWQSRAQSIARDGRFAPIELPDDSPVVLTPTHDKAIKTEGTNMAFRRPALVEIGGFDSRYRFFLDETDVNLRLADRGAKTAIVPLAQVHHRFAASAMRRGDRVPRDLFEIGASWAVFLNAHCSQARRAAAWRRVQDEQRSRLIAHLIDGGIEPRDMRRLLQRLEAGFAEGSRRDPDPAGLWSAPDRKFQRFPTTHDGSTAVVAGRIWQLRALRRRARILADSGANVTLFCLSPTALFHRVTWRDGYWQQIGGLFGKSERTQRLFTLWRFSTRIRAETCRVSLVRGFTRMVARTRFIL